MSGVWPALGQAALLVALLALTVPAVGRLLAHTYTSERHLAVERGAYRLLRHDPDADQRWRTYALSVLAYRWWACCCCTGSRACSRCCR